MLTYEVFWWICWDTLDIEHLKKDTSYVRCEWNTAKYSILGNLSWKHEKEDFFVIEIPLADINRGFDVFA